MRYVMRRNAAMAAVLASSLVGWTQAAQASCTISEFTNASNVQYQPGAGSWQCSQFSTSNGPMVTITSGVTSMASGGKVTWSAGPGVDVDLVSINRNNGNRCNYYYAEQSAGGMDLQPPEGGSGATVTFCADGILSPTPPPEPEIITTLEDGCVTSFTSGSEPLLDANVAFGFTAASPGGQEQVAVCASSAQRECLPNPPRKSYDKASCTGAILPLATCAPVEYEAGDAKYCWYYENQVCDANTLTDEPELYVLWGCNDRLGTFRPKTEVGGIDFSVTVFDGSTTYTTCTRSRCWTSTQ
jgi:hypothetical protein